MDTPSKVKLCKSVEARIIRIGALTHPECFPLGVTGVEAESCLKLKASLKPLLFSAQKSWDAVLLSLKEW